MFGFTIDPEVSKWVLHRLKPGGKSKSSTLLFSSVICYQNEEMVNKLLCMKSINNNNSHKTSLLTEMFYKVCIIDMARKRKLTKIMGHKTRLHGHMIWDTLGIGINIPVSWMSDCPLTQSNYVKLMLWV